MKSLRRSNEAAVSKAAIIRPWPENMEMEKPRRARRQKLETAKLVPEPFAGLQRGRVSTVRWNPKGMRRSVAFLEVATR